jgi:hypothetical protein
VLQEFVVLYKRKKASSFFDRTKVKISGKNCEPGTNIYLQDSNIPTYVAARIYSAAAPDCNLTGKISKLGQESYQTTIKTLLYCFLIMAALSCKRPGSEIIDVKQDTVPDAYPDWYTLKAP